MLRLRRRDVARVDAVIREQARNRGVSPGVSPDLINYSRERRKLIGELIDAGAHSEAV